jgi:glutamate synthase (NADPH/NADH) small chain
MMRYGIPSYRLPAERIADDIDVIRSMGVEIRCNIRIGQDITLAQLHENHDAVLLGIGLQFGRSTRIPGSDHPGVHSAVDLLRRIRLGEFVAVPPAAVVIGGGNTAMDMARSLARLQIAQHGLACVTITALEDREHLLADQEELRETGEEGITILPARGPQRCDIDDSACIDGLFTVAVRSIYDEFGRFAPCYDDSDVQLHRAGMVVEAIGQQADLALLGEELTERLAWDRGRLQTDNRGQTSEPWLWAAGDLVNGPDVIHAVADGHRAATGIGAWLAEFAEATA